MLKKNKEIDTSVIAKKKFNLMVAVVILLMMISFIALKINDSTRQAANNSTSTDALSSAESNNLNEERKVNVSDVVSADKLTQVAQIEPIVKEDHVIGSSTESVTMIVYSDFECSYCAQFAETVEQARKEFGDKISVVFRHYPLIESHPSSLLAAEASECAADQGKFWEMHDALFLAQRAGNLNVDSINQAAKDIKLASTEFSDCLSTEKYKSKILDQVKEAKAATVSGSPTTFVDGELVTGATPYEDGVHSDGSKLEGLKSIITRHLNK